MYHTFRQHTQTSLPHHVNEANARYCFDEARSIDCRSLLVSIRNIFNPEIEVLIASAVALFSFIMATTKASHNVIVIPSLVAWESIEWYIGCTSVY